MAGKSIEELLAANDSLGEIPIPTWLRKPASIKSVTSVKNFVERADDFFEKCATAGVRPTITGFCLSVGLPGPTSLIRLGQRIPELRHIISSCMTAIAHGYESMIGNGNTAGAMFMLKNIPDFDPDDPEGSAAVQFFNDRKEIYLQADVHGGVTLEELEDPNADPIETYLALIKKPVSPTVKKASEGLLSRAEAIKLKTKPQGLITILGRSSEQ